MKKKIPFGIVIGLSTALMSVSTFSCAKYESCSYVGLYEEYEPNYTPYTESTIIAQKTLDAYMSNENRKQMICQDLLNTINFIYRPYEAEVTNYEYFVQLNDLVEKTTATSTVYVLSYYMSIRASVNHQKLFEIQVKNLPYWTATDPFEPANDGDDFDLYFCPTKLHLHNHELVCDPTFWLDMDFEVIQNRWNIDGELLDWNVWNHKCLDIWEQEKFIEDDYAAPMLFIYPHFFCETEITK